MSQQEYQRRSLEIDWPDGTDETIATEGAWPAADSSAEFEPQLDESKGAERVTQVDRNVTTKLNELGRRLSREQGDPS